MKKRFEYLIPSKENGKFILKDADTGLVRTDIYVRDIMLEKAVENGQCIKFDNESQRSYRKPMSVLDNNKVVKEQPVVDSRIMEDPVLSFIHNDSLKLKPETLVMQDLKWKYLVRSAMRGKNIMMTGPAGCGKTMAAKTLVKALDRPDFYFNLGATQDPRGTLIGNTHFKKDEGTLFSESVFVKAIQTENAIILLDELSRAHPEAWNILMTVLDEGQRYLRLDEAENAPTIKVAKGVTFIATANIGSEYTATRAMDRALVDRFIIVEMDTLSKEEEAKLLLKLYPDVTPEQADTISEIASMTRAEMISESPKLSSAISTRLSVELAGLLSDGFTLEEGAEVAIYPFFDADGGVDSERTYMKQLVQKYIGSDSEDELFNAQEEAEAEEKLNM